MYEAPVANVLKGLAYAAQVSTSEETRNPSELPDL